MQDDDQLCTYVSGQLLTQSPVYADNHQATLAHVFCGVGGGMGTETRQRGKDAIHYLRQLRLAQSTLNNYSVDELRSDSRVSSKTISNLRMGRAAEQAPVDKIWRALCIRAKDLEVTLPDDYAPQAAQFRLIKLQENPLLRSMLPLLPSPTPNLPDEEPDPSRYFTAEKIDQLLEGRFFTPWFKSQVVTALAHRGLASESLRRHFQKEEDPRLIHAIVAEEL